MKKIILVSAAALGFLGVNAFANMGNAFTKGIYVGLQAGYDMNAWGNVSNPDNRAFFGTYISQENGFAGRVLGGWDFHPNFAVEMGYFRAFNKPVSMITGSDWWRYTTQGFDLMGKMKYAFDDNFGVYAKFGLDYLLTQIDPQGTNTTISGYSVDNFNIAYGLGFGYEVAQNLTLDVSWTRFQGKSKVDGDQLQPRYQEAIDFFALGLVYRFNL